MAFLTLAPVTESERPQSANEELANTLSHGLGFALAAFVGLPLLIVAALRHHNGWELASGTIFGLSMALLYGASTLYHLLPPGRPKDACRLLDHAAIYLLIAGTYTPFALGPLRGPWGWGLLAAVWLLAGAGILLKIRVGFHRPWVSTVLYLLMGWLVLLVVRPLIAQLGWVGLGWLLAGGCSYSLGVIFFLAERRHYAHVLWHAFVLLGSFCHFVAVFGYAWRR